MKKVVISILIIIFLSFICVYFIKDISKKNEIKLVECIDGDTAWFMIDKQKEKVRLLGIDTPESVHPNKVVEEYGIEASDYTCSLLENADNIYLEYEINSDKHDKYERVLGWVFVDNNNLSELLLSKGYAQVDYIYGDYKYIDELCEVQEQAYSSKIGIWENSGEEEYSNNYCNKLYYK